MRRAQWLFATTVAAVLALSRPAGGQVAPPTGATVATHAAAVHLDATRAASVTTAGRTATFTPLADADLPLNAKALESGATVGALTVAGSGSALAPGQYHVFVAKTAEGWQAVLERGGKIVTTSRAVTVTSEATPRAIPRPQIQATASGAEDENQDSGPTDAVVTSRSGKVTITVSGKGWKVTVSFSW